MCSICCIICKKGSHTISRWMKVQHIASIGVPCNPIVPQNEWCSVPTTVLNSAKSKSLRMKMVSIHGEGLKGGASGRIPPSLMRKLRPPTVMRKLRPQAVMRELQPQTMMRKLRQYGNSLKGSSERRTSFRRFGAQTWRSLKYGRLLLFQPPVSEAHSSARRHYFVLGSQYIGL